MSAIIPILAPNPGPMTLTGTHSFVLQGARSPEAAVVDPGPDDPTHLNRLVAATDVPITSILITHSHPDHIEGLPGLVKRTGARVLGAPDLADGQVLHAGGLEVTVIATPGHTADSMSFLIAAERTLLAGDHFLGSGTPVVAHPDGDLADYLTSLARVRELATRGQVTRVLPSHGDPIDDVVARSDAYLAHRLERLEQVRVALRAGATTADEVTDAVYPNVAKAIRFAALMTVRAQLAYLSRDVAG